MSDPKRERDIWAVIPAKPLAEAKSRFGLDREQRQAIAQDFLLRVLQVVRGAIPARNAIVVSRDEDILAIARALGLRALREKAGGDLNDALGAAAVYAQARGAVGVLSVFSDLPYLLAEDLEAMIAAFDGDNLVIAPDEDGAGSNALLMRPRAVPYRHGHGSFWRHIEAAQDKQLAFAVVARAGLMRDVDTPEQLSAFVANSVVLAKRDLHFHA